MIARKRGKVINVASVLATRVARYMSSYLASKAALVQLTRATALEWIHHNIQVNALCPGYFLTPMNQDFFTSDAGHKFVQKLPIRRLGDPKEIEGAAVFLASDATSYITGTTLYVDGGHSLA
jgi:NAD(P)-dependent dehydrogenase (short-subunit alcohol dehydrogenase family)